MRASKICPLSDLCGPARTANLPGSAVETMEARSGEQDSLVQSTIQDVLDRVEKDPLSPHSPGSGRLQSTSCLLASKQALSTVSNRQPASAQTVQPGRRRPKVRPVALTRCTPSAEACCCRRQSSTADAYADTGLELGVGPDAATRLAAARQAGLAAELKACRASLADKDQQLQACVRVQLWQRYFILLIRVLVQAALQELQGLKATRARQDKGQKALTLQAEQAKHEAHEARTEAAAAAARCKELSQHVRRVSQDRCAAAFAPVEPNVQPTTTVQLCSLRLSAAPLPACHCLQEAGGRQQAGPAGAPAEGPGRCSAMAAGRPAGTARAAGAAQQPGRPCPGHEQAAGRCAPRACCAGQVQADLCCWAQTSSSWRPRRASCCSWSSSTHGWWTTCAGRRPTWRLPPCCPSRRPSSRLPWGTEAGLGAGECQDSARQRSNADPAVS